MTKDDLKELLANGMSVEAYSKFSIYRDAKRLEIALKQYDPNTHEVITNIWKRPDKEVKSEPRPHPDFPNDPTKDLPGELERIVPVARLPLALQKRIVYIASAFLGQPSMHANPIDDAQTNFMELMEKVWDDNKLDWKFNELAEMTMAYRESAELWYTENTGDLEYWDGFAIKAGPVSISTRVIGPEYGDELYPIWDDFNKMIAFGRRFQTLDVNGQTNKNFELYTDETVYTITQYADGIQEAQSKPNPFKKIPVIYYWQPEVEWYDVQHLIERLETKISNHADVNDYFDSPTVVVKGKIVSFAEKGEAGKVIEVDGEKGSVEYLTWDQAPESAKLEMENLTKWIYQLTSTPDISFDSMKSLGAFSGIALKMFFFDAHMKAKRKEARVFGEPQQRRINLMKTLLVFLDNSLKVASKVKIKPKFEFYLPEDQEAKINLLVSAVTNKLISQESAVRQSGLVEDAQAEIDLIKAEGDQAFERQQALAVKLPPAGSEPPKTEE